jgi:hypothetical protein
MKVGEAAGVPAPSMRRAAWCIAPHAGKLVLPLLAGVGDIDVADLAAESFLDLAPVAFDPGILAQ